MYLVRISYMIQTHLRELIGNISTPQNLRSDTYIGYRRRWDGKKKKSRNLQVPRNQTRSKSINKVNRPWEIGSIRIGELKEELEKMLLGGKTWIRWPRGKSRGRRRSVDFKCRVSMGVITLISKTFRFVIVRFAGVLREILVSKLKRAIGEERPEKGDRICPIH